MLAFSPLKRSAPVSPDAPGWPAERPAGEPRPRRGRPPAARRAAAAGAVALGVAAGFAAPAAAYQYVKPAFPAVYLVRPASIRMEVDPDPGDRLTASITLNGTTFPMQVDAAAHQAVFRPDRPLAPGEYRGQIRIDGTAADGGTYEPLVVPFAFRVAADAPANLPPLSLAGLAAWRQVNLARAQAGLPPVGYSPGLQAASQGHADYVARHQELYGPAVSFHVEPDASAAGYVGRTVLERDAAFDVPEGGDEVGSAGDPNPAAAVVGLLDTTFHRFGLLSPAVTLFGAGFTRTSDDPSLPWPNPFVADMAESGPGPAAWPVVLYPAPGQTGVPLAFAGELPDPLAAVGAENREPVGYPVTIQFTDPQIQAIHVSSAWLQGPGGRVPSWRVDQDNYVDLDPVYTGETMDRAAALFAQATLAPSTTYTAHFAGVVVRKDGSTAPFSRTWSFTTRPPTVAQRAWMDAGRLFVVGTGLFGSQAPDWAVVSAGPGPTLHLEGAYPTLLVFRVAGDPRLVTGIRVGDGSAPATPVGPPPFNDMGDAPWATAEVDEAYGLGLVGGVGGGRFDPNDPVTQEQALSVLYRAVGSPGAGGVPPVPGTSPWAAQAVAWAVGTGIADPTQLVPQAPATRAQAVAWLMEAFGVPPLSSSPSFADAAAIPPALAGYVAAAQGLGVARGYAGAFNPQDPLTRAQLAALVERVAAEVTP
jgi:uncharacterized protein YkwD